MDAGIIAAFKRRYRRYHLQNKIDCDERGEAGNIYKVDQITAMRWSVAAWNEISDNTIANCFNHTRLLSDLPDISTAVDVKRKGMARRSLKMQNLSWSRS
ncbi:unnamed protein product [Peronospora farinosa]|nr:unnamed protein product [Peronospora farinosa]